jgi:hypothetical protein
MSGSNYSNSTDSTEELQFGLITQSTQVSSGLTSLGSSLADLLPFENDISSLFANGNPQSGLFQLGIDLPSSVNGTVASGGSAINFGQLNFGVSLPGTTFSNAVDAAIPINPGDLELGITLPSASASVVLPEVPSLYSAIGNLSSGLASLESPSSSPQKIYVVYGGYGGGGYSGGGSGGTYTFTIPTNNSSGGSQSSYNSTSISSLINQVSSELNLARNCRQDRGWDGWRALRRKPIEIGG